MSSLVITNPLPALTHPLGHTWCTVGHIINRTSCAKVQEFLWGYWWIGNNQEATLFAFWLSLSPSVSLSLYIYICIYTIHLSYFCKVWLLCINSKSLPSFLLCTLLFESYCLKIFKLSFTMNITVLTPVSCDHVTSFNYDRKRARDLDLACRCHLCNTMRGKSMRQGIACFFAVVFFSALFLYSMGVMLLFSFEWKRWNQSYHYNIKGRKKILNYSANYIYKPSKLFEVWSISGDFRLRLLLTGSFIWVNYFAFKPGNLSFCSEQPT